MKQGAGPPGPRALPSDTVALYSLRWLDADSIATHLPYPVAAYVVRQRPGAGLPNLPRRTPRPLYDETMHLSYALQWFLFAILIPGGTAALAWSRRRRTTPHPTPEVLR